MLLLEFLSYPLVFSPVVSYNELAGPARPRKQKGGSIMLSIEKQAHDLAILYMQMWIKDDLLKSSADEDRPDFVRTYQEQYQEFLKLLKK